MFLSRKFANTRSTKALRDYFAHPESPPTSATLIAWEDALCGVGNFLIISSGDEGLEILQRNRFHCFHKVRMTPKCKLLQQWRLLAERALQMRWPAIGS